MPRKTKHFSLKQFKVPFDKGIKIETLPSFKQFDKDKYWIFPTGGSHPLNGLPGVPEMYNKDIWPMIISVTRESFVKQVPNVGMSSELYPKINLSRTQIGKGTINKVYHRMIAEAFLPNPNKFPLVVKYIGEIRDEYNKKYDVNYGRHITELARIRDEAREKGAWSAATNAEIARGKAAGLYIEQKIIHHNKVQDLTTDELKAKMKKILDDNKGLIEADFTEILEAPAEHKQS